MQFMYSVQRYRYVKIQNTVCLKFSVFNALLLLLFFNFRLPESRWSPSQFMSSLTHLPSKNS